MNNEDYEFIINILKKEGTEAIKNNNPDLLLRIVKAMKGLCETQEQVQHKNYKSTCTVQIQQ